MTATSVTGDRAPSLERDAIGLPEVLFQCITHMAPAVATALSIGAATGFAGGLTPLAVLFAMIACLFTAYSIGQMARHLPGSAPEAHGAGEDRHVYHRSGEAHTSVSQSAAGDPPGHQRHLDRQ